jgi:hypothetical protein
MEVAVAVAVAVVVEQEEMPMFLMLMKMMHLMQFLHVLHRFLLLRQFLLLLENETYEVTTLELLSRVLVLLWQWQCVAVVDSCIPAAVAVTQISIHMNMVTVEGKAAVETE